MGSAVHISLPSRLAKGDKIQVQIQYETSPSSTALQWLEKEYVWNSSENMHLNRGSDRPRENSSRTCLVNANQFMQGLLLHCKVRVFPYLDEHLF